MAFIYIAVVDTPGFFASCIRKFLKQRYIHVVIAADERLDEAYSIGRRNPAVPVIAGFEKEEKDKILRSFPLAYYQISRIECTESQKTQILKNLHTDYKRRFRIHYAVCSLPFIIANHPFYLKDQYTCSSYIAKILAENGIIISEKHFSLVTPKDFIEYTDMEKIYEGPLYKIESRSFDYTGKRNSVYES